jgi:hypothetical protein
MTNQYLAEFTPYTLDMFLSTKSLSRATLSHTGIFMARVKTASVGVASIPPERLADVLAVGSQNWRHRSKNRAIGRRATMGGR